MKLAISRFAILTGALSLTAHAQNPYLNLDFETATRGQPWVWSQYGPAGYEVALDQAVSFSGTQSLRIRYMSGPTTLSAGVVQYLPLESSRGRHMRFSGYVKTDSITKNYAALWLRVNSGPQIIQLYNAPLSPNGTTDWQPFVIDQDILPTATSILIGALNFSDGTAWFDNLSILIDGVPYTQPPAPNTGPPTEIQLNWVKQTAIPILTEDPAVAPDDLAPLGNIVGDAHIVGLGEGTHGTSEFFHMKHRVLEYLVTQKGFNLFAMEANMPEAYRLNDYVLNGNGDPKKLLQGMYFWTWNTQEVLDMILWMREYNASGKGPVQFTGFDMQYGAVALDNVREFVARADPAYLPTFAVASQFIKPVATGSAVSSGTVMAAYGQTNAVWQYLTEHRSAYLANSSEWEVDWAIQNVQVLAQSIVLVIANQTDGNPFRDWAMSVNMEWILQHNPGAKAVIWAHDGHVSRATGWMGSYLAAEHGSDYLNVAQIFHAGQYNAVNASSSGRVVVNDATPSFPGTLEFVMHATGMPKLILDLRTATPKDPGSSWLFGTTQYRTVGALAGDGFFFTPQITKDFDLLIFFDRTHPSTLLPFN